MAKKVKLYASEAWMRRKYLHEKLSEAEIAALADTTQATINTWLRKFGLRN